jgi:hypothetical protein
MFSSIMLGALFLSTILLTFGWFMLLRQFGGKNVHEQSYHIKDLPLVASVVGLVTLTRGSEFVHKYVLSGPVSNGIVTAHMCTFLVSAAWFDGFNHMTELDPHCKALNYRTMKSNTQPTITLVSTYLLYGIVTSANYVNNGMIRDGDSSFQMGGRRQASAKAERWDGAYVVDLQPHALPLRTHVVCGA